MNPKSAPYAQPNVLPLQIKSASDAPQRVTRPVLPVEVLECGGPQIQINPPGAPPAELSLCRNRTSRTKPHVSARVKQNFEHLTALPGRGRLGDLHGLFFPRREGEDIKVARDLQRNFQHLDTDVQENGRLHRSISEGEEIRVGERTSKLPGAVECENLLHR